MTNPPKARRKPGRKSNAERAKLAAIEAAPKVVSASDIYIAECGPIPGRAKLTDHELTGLFAESLYAHDMQGEMIRFDTLGRKWTFRPNVIEGRSYLQLICKLGLDEVGDHISTQTLGCDEGKPAIERTIRRMDAEL